MIDAHTLSVLGVPLAASWDGLQGVPARLVDDALILKAGYADAEEWRMMDAKNKAAR
ncbi:MAG: hypothetical protein IIC29_08635 [Chloroflexi bacterium]|nr:hypothetical protein [Chloroflexota bacterium]